MAASRSLLVAAISRTLTLIGCVPPSRSISRSCSTRSSLTCVAGRQLADLVEEQRAAVGQLELALLGGLGVGEGARLVAEQLRLDQLLGQRAAVHLHVGLVGARRVVVQRVRDQLLAGARLAANQHRGRGAGHLRHLLVEGLHRPAGADDVAEVVALLQLLAQLRVLLLQPLPLGLHQALDADRLADERAGHHQQLARCGRAARRPGTAAARRCAPVGAAAHAITGTADERRLARAARPEARRAVERTTARG